MTAETFHLASMKEMGARVYILESSGSISTIRAYSHACQIASAFNPTILQGWMYRGNFLASMIGRKFKLLPFWGIFCTPLGSRARLPARLFYRLQARLSGFTSAIAYNGTQAHAQHVADGFSDHNSIVFVNGIDIDRFRPRPDLRARLRQELGLRDNDFTVLVAARVHPQKDWPTIIEAARRAPNITVLAAGAGTQTLPNLPNIKRLGVRTDMDALYNSADLFSLSSTFGEGTSVAISESLACGTPAIVTEIGDNADAVGGAGLVVPLGDPASLSVAWTQLSADRERLHRLKATARAIAIERFDGRQSFQPIFSAYEKEIR